MRERISGFLSKLFFEILPATVASAVAGFLFGHLGILGPSTPQAASPASAEMLKMVHDDHEAFVQFLQKAAENKSDATVSIQQAEARLKQEEQAAQEALRQAKEAEAKAVAAARAAERAGDRKLAAKTSPQGRAKPAPADGVLGQIVVGQPMPITPAPSPVAAATPTPPQPAPAPEQHWSIGGTAHNVAASVSGWFSAAEPPRPPGSLPQANFSAAADVLAPRLGQP
jgi:hypothetical protein